MCNLCIEINRTIARYQRLAEQVRDQQTQDAVAHLVTELEGKKLALHPKQ